MPSVDTKVYEEKLLQSVSKTNSILSCLKSFSVDIVTYGTVFWMGYNKYSPIWLFPPLFILAIKDQWELETEKRKFNEIIKTLRNEEKELVLADLKQLPPWVHYPDVDQCGWLNKLVSHFWPLLCNFVEDAVKKDVEPIVRERLSGFRLQTVSLGSVPPTVTGIKVYDKHVRSDQLIADVHVCYSGDSEFGFSFLGVPGGVKNLQLRGPARINLKLLPSLPFVGGVEFSFLQVPEIDFILTGVGSCGFTDEFAHKAITGQILSRLVFPKKISLKWNDTDHDCLPESEGVIRLNVVEAKGLEDKDGFLNSGKSDPYAEVSCGSKTFWSKVIDDCSEPKWDMWCEFVSAKNNNEPIKIKIFDKDVGTMDEGLGTYSLKQDDVKKSGKLDSWFKLTNGKGSIHVRAFFVQISPDIKLLSFPPPELSYLSSYILEVAIQSAHNIVSPRSSIMPSSIVSLTVGNDTQTTKTVFNNSNPVFGQGFSFLVNNPEFNTLRAKILDKKDKAELGYFSYRLRKLLDRKEMKINQQHFPLTDSAADSSVLISMRLKVLRNESF